MMACAAAVLLGQSAWAQTTPPLKIEASEMLEWNQSEGTYLAVGDAHARQGEASISAESLQASYDPESESRRITLVVATGSVIYENETSTARGDRLVYNVGSETYLLEGKSAMVSGPNGTMQATKDINFDATNPDQQKLVAHGNAKYVDKQGRSVAGDEIIALLDANGELQQLDATRNVTVVSINGQTATGDAVTYDYGTSKALLTGNVEIIDGPSVMRGARAEVDFDSGISRILSDGSGKRVSGVLNQ